MGSCKSDNFSFHSFEESLMNASEIETIVMQGDIPFIACYLVKHYGLKKDFAIDVAIQMINRPDGC